MGCAKRLTAFAIHAILPFIIFAAISAPSLAQKPAAWHLIPNRMCDQRWAPGAALLASCKAAIIAGGYSYSAKSCVSTIDLFDEPKGRFGRSCARLSYPRDFLQANRLPNGKVLLTGGFNDVWGSMNVADLYDPPTDSCRLTRGRMVERRELFQAVGLADGTVLLTGGLNLWERTTLSSAEIYHPETEQFTPTAGAMAQDRFGQAACLLADGLVFVVGGTHWDLRKKESRVLDSAEIYDPATGLFHTATGHLIAARDRPTATLLPSGRVLIFGGQGPGGAAVTTAELFDPATEQFTTSPAPKLEPRMAHSATLGAGSVVITGGWDASTKSTTATSVVFDPRTAAIDPLPNLPFASHDAAQLVFPDGVVLVAGGKVVAGGKASSTDKGATLECEGLPSL